ncbi:NADH-dependent gamma-hydroxybutyrate dehydrogenase [Pantoea agglomerans]|uniref:NADH-dependent gamma-hydroxybutyrate dehydrogenase n=1 Tax=Enterobacter agglomerans TaxID=549 RepID=A0A379AH94_ENTAG|nr:NADH-dependent gamma-hydroxybutyrate dehydrogenase [Pantoea agglomerans]
MKQPEVAVLGLGAMGHAFAAKPAEKWLSRSWLEPQPARAAKICWMRVCQLADSPAEAVREADVVIAMLSDGDTTEQVLHQVQEAFKQGATLCQMGTIA